MFGRNHFINPPSLQSIGEDLSSRKVSRYLTENVLDDDDNLLTRVVPKVVDLSVPQTPQTGIECVSHDLSYAFSHHLPIDENASRLSLLGGGNPLADFRVFKSIMKDSDNPDFVEQKKDK